MRVLYTLLIGLFFSTALMAQPANDECDGAIFINDPNSYCSGEGEFSIAGATASPQAIASCWSSSGDDVWFSFRATRPGISVRMIGATNIFTGGTLSALNKSIAIYAGSCGGLLEVACRDKVGGDNVLTTSADVNVGDVYFIRISITGGNAGNFRLCLTSFDEVPDPVSDCEPGVLLCDKAPFIVPFLEDSGNVPNEITMDGAPCDEECGFIEEQSAWYKWICDEPGTLTFTLTPLNPVDDLDFWVFELPNGVDDCTDKMPVRCMTSGATGTNGMPDPPSEWIRCHGPTGLSSTEGDDHEDCGCTGPDNNFIAPLQMEAGKAYALIVMNFSNTDDGFSIEFGGTGTFLGPEIDFIIDPEIDNQCDIDQVTFIDNSSPQIGNIISYDWNFGAGADMRESDLIGPHDITYGSFGPKSIVLRIGTDAGCQKTLIQEIFIESCCDPDNTLQLDIVNQRDPLCPGIDDGVFNIGGTGGSPDYSFSADGTIFNPRTNYAQLEPGVYNVWIQDIKGCRDSIEVVIDPAPEFLVDAGSPETVLLGCETQLNAEIFGNPPFTFAWDTVANMSCFDCLDPMVLPPGSTTYVIRAESAAGCSSVDSVQIDVEVVRPFYIPSAFSPNNDGINDFFTGFGGKQVTEIKRLIIFDRWGNMLFEKLNFPAGVETEGWDGMFRGDEMDSFVFAYYFEVEYVDGVIVEYEGDVSLLR